MLSQLLSKLTYEDFNDLDARFVDPEIEVVKESFSGDSCTHFKCQYFKDLVFSRCQFDGFTVHVDRFLARVSTGIGLGSERPTVPLGSIPGSHSQFPPYGLADLVSIRCVTGIV